MISDDVKLKGSQMQNSPFCLWPQHLYEKCNYLLLCVCILCCKSGVSNPPVLVNKVLLEHNDVHSFMQRLWLISSYNGRIEQLRKRLYVVCKTESITSLAFYRSLPFPALNPWGVNAKFPSTITKLLLLSQKKKYSKLLKSNCNTWLTMSVI